VIWICISVLRDKVHSLLQSDLLTD
jgi:hypothetical protein